MNIDYTHSTSNYDLGDNSCTVHALANSAGIPIERANYIAEMAGRIRGKGFHSFKLVKFAEKHGIKFEQVTMKRMTLNRFVKEYPTGSFYIRFGGHALAVVDGVVVDNCDPRPRRFVLSAWRLLSKSDPRPKRPSVKETKMKPSNALASYRYTLGSLADLKDAYSYVYQAALRDVRKNYPVAMNNKSLLFVNDDEGRVSGFEEASFINDVTKREVVAYVNKAVEALVNDGHSPIGAEVCIDIVFDGALSVWEYRNGNYDPQVECVSLVIWDAQNGWRY